MLTSEQDRVLRRVLRLADLSGDLDRNKSDGDFADSGGLIYRVVDENVFEMFIRPSRQRESVETFYGDLWSSANKVDEEWRSFESQAALVTAEFVLLGKERGRRRPILMSDHHRWELAHRVEALTSEIRAEVTGRRKHVKRELRTKLSIGYDLEHGRVDRSVDYRKQLKSESLASDLAELATAPLEVRNRFEIARLAAAFFANDPFTEPLDQLSRTVSVEIQSKLSSLQATFQPSAKEAALIEADADRWFERLALELRQPGHRHRWRSQREIAKGANAQKTPEVVARALRNDARTIAFVQWVSRARLDRMQRIVFITGDPVLFDAYRRWYVTTAPSAKVSQPFVLRRATQYSPIFNPTESGGDLSFVPATDLNRSLLFTLIQQAVEAALLPLPFALHMQTRALAGSAINLTRERLALKLVDNERPELDEELSGLSHLLSVGWVQARGKEIESIRESWQKAQRFAIGASTDLISLRLGKALREAASRFFDTTALNATRVLSGYVADVLDKLVDDSILLWLPLAEGFGQGVFDQEPRTARAKRFMPAIAQARSNDGRSVLSTAPKAVFSRAACRALEIQDAANANRFAVLARRADRVDAIRKNDSASTDFDIVYLQSVTHRYLISTVDTHLKRSDAQPRRSVAISRGVEQVKLHHGQASSLIERCLAVHALEVDEPAEMKTHWNARLRYLRALSERAALNLFMATSLGLAWRVGQSPLLADYDHYLEYARGDLWRCVNADEYDQDDDEMLSLIRSQYIANLAAFDVLSYVVSSGAKFKLQAWPRKSRRRIRQIWLKGENIHPLLEAELKGYLILTEDTLAGSAPRVRRQISQDQRQLRLPLDRELFRTIYRELPKAASLGR